jgi:TetR/AcrR family tetracycline transcriptional repressor
MAAAEVVGRTAFDLDAEEIVRAAIEILQEEGLDAVSMRSVSARLGVSPVPVYKRIGNKESLLDAMADHLLAGIAPEREPGEPWQAYATRWAMAVRDRLSQTRNVRLLLGERRSIFVEASRPLIDALRAGGFSADAAVQACRLVLWATVGFVVVQAGRPEGGSSRGKRRRPGGDPSGVTKVEADHLFALHLRYLLEGLERDPHGFVPA